MQGIGMSVVFLWVAFIVFGSVTVGVMMMMDVLECSLHTLRLHWAEFQGKFYVGGGHSFNPLVLNQELTLESESQANQEKDKQKSN